LEDAANAKGDKEVTEASKAKDEGILSDTNAECKQTSDEYEKNQVVRIGEVRALTEAIKIMSSPDVTGMGEKHLPASLLQTKASAFAQLRAGQDNLVRQRVVEFLQGRAQKLGSKYLALMATRAGSDPFAKIKKMIKDLIVKLMEEANAEADQHAYCETELATNKQTREIKSSEVEELTAELESQNALREKLTTEITELSDEVAEIKGQQNEATKIRGDEKKTNKFQKLMGASKFKDQVKDDAEAKQNADKLLNKQSEMFNAFDNQFHASRIQTHQARGRGFGN